jgi:hypothetical protein
VIKNITNPFTVGGTGKFKLATWKGINLLDYNDMFESIGIEERA